MKSILLVFAVLLPAIKKMKKLYTAIFIIGIIAEIVLVVFFDKKVTTYGSVIFWAIGLFGILILWSKYF